MNFAGTGKRLARGDVGDAARELGVETAVLLAFLEVEAAGRGFDRSNRPKMLFEPHVFYRNLSGAKQARAVRDGIAYKGWKPGKYPRDSYPRLAKAIEIDEEAAYRSASYGLPQILGENYKAAGYPSAKAMFEDMAKGERQQLLAMVRLLKSWGLNKALVGKDFSKASSWERAAKRYNGSGYKRHGYHIKLASAYRKHSGKKSSVKQTANKTLVSGDRGEYVRNLQSDLAALGYDVGVIDGRFGPQTKKTVEAFQRKSGLTVDGKAGPKTKDAIKKAIEDMHSDSVDEPVTGPDKSFVGGIIQIAVNFLLSFMKGERV